MGLGFLLWGCIFCGLDKLVGVWGLWFGGEGLKCGVVCEAGVIGEN